MSKQWRIAMKVKINVLSMNLIAIPGEPNHMNNTTVYKNNITLWPTPDGEERPERPFDVIKEGDELSITIPSGTLTGTVSDMECMEPNPGCLPMHHISLVDVVWDGQHAGLANGCCGAGGWRFYKESATDVETSVADDLREYTDYLFVRTIAEHIKDCYGFPEEKQELLRKAWHAVKTLREEVAK
jgi:hypothetical protein